jgi:hypothetical protein
MRKIIKLKKENVFKTSLFKCIEMQDLHVIFFNSNIFLVIFMCRFWKTF